MFNFLTFLEEIEQSPIKTSSQLYNPEICHVDTNKIEGSIFLSPVLQFLTGSNVVGSTLKSKKISIKFDHKAPLGKLVFANTCILELTFPATSHYSDGTNFVEKVVGGMLMNATGFSVA